MSNRKKRSDSTDVSIAAFKAATTNIDPPSYLKIDEDARPFWDDIIATKSLNSWTPNDLIVAATLSRTYRDIEKYMNLVEKNTRLTKTESGGIRVNAAHRVLVDLIPQAAAMARSIQVHARATQGESRDQSKTNLIYREARNSINYIDNDLIPRPVAH